MSFDHHPGREVQFTIALSQEDAQALAQFVKRAGYSDARANAVDEQEAYQMISGLNAIRAGLAQQGFAPR